MLKKHSGFVLGLFSLLIAVSAFALYSWNESATLPILNEKIKGTNQYKTLKNVKGFNQLGKEFELYEAKNKIHVANFFFCSCPVVCPKMTQETKKVYAAFEGNPEVLFISYSIDPKRDSADRLNNFAQKFDIDGTQWQFVNVGKENVYNLARNDYKITAVMGSEGNNDYIHSELLTLIDQDFNIRGYYDSTEPKEINKLIKDIKKLLK